MFAQNPNSSIEKRSDANQPSNSVGVPALSLPKGGGAIQGIGEKFAANPVTGTGSMTVPIATSPGRAGFGPQLSLSYDSGSGNGPFGFGWSLGLPHVTRKTDKGLPQYNDADESDDFLLSGAEDLVPLLNADTRRFEDRTTAPGYVIHRYRPRIEGLFARIERWTRLSDGDVHWRSISRDNVLTIYGKDAGARIADPMDAKRVFTWLICETRDDKGNVVLYEYKPEDGEGLNLAMAHERNRGPRDDPRRRVNRYIKRIRYGNRAQLLDTSGQRPRFLNYDQINTSGWMFEVVFDYGEHDPSAPKPSGNAPWTYRTDTFSTYRAGFEIRTTRRCQRVLMFHHFEHEVGVGNDCLVRSTDFTYADESNPPDPRSPIHSFLRAITHCGYRREGNGYLKRTLPVVEFEYSVPVVQGTVREVDAASIENLPTGLDGVGYQWTDLHGEGIPGILTEQAGTWFYKRNLSPISDRTIEFAAIERVATKPNFGLVGGQAQLMDLAGDGQPDLVILEGPTPGFYEHDAEEGWGVFRPFAARLNRDSRDPNLRFIDLDGDGHADVLITEDEALVWHASLAEDGFGSARRVQRTLDEENGPRLVFADPSQSIYLADMNGDGLTDLVRIRNGEVCYWPNLGYGRFGAKVAMDQAPHFDRPDGFDQRRIRLADIDGSGTNDLIYLGGEGVTLYFNQSGNSWSAGQRVTAFPAVDNIAAIQVVDLMGNGTACLVWSSPLPGNAIRPMRYVDLMGGQKPHLLIRLVNNLGAESVVHYAPSTKFYLADKLAGKPWLTKLPFPVHVVERVETYDRISGNRFVARYAYHHGYFDGPEREFRGFGMVEQFDTEEFATLSESTEFPSGTNIDAPSHVPPVLTRTWFHTGIYLGRQSVSNFFAGVVDDQDNGEYYREPGLTDAEASALLLDDMVLPPGLNLEEEREACRALKGTMLRQEIYSLDATEKEPHPYTVTEQNFTIRVLQPKAANRHAVFLAHAREAVSFQYERNFADPRIAHALTFDADDYGNVLKSAAVAYGRRHADPSLSSADQARQAQLHITCTENSYTNVVDSSEGYRAPRPSESRAYELGGISPGAGETRFGLEGLLDAFATAAPLAYEESLSANQLQKRLIEHVRTQYRPDDLGAAAGDPLALLPLGQLESLALPGESYKLAFTPGLVAQQFGIKVNDDMLESEGRYVHSQGDVNWWIGAGRIFLSPGANDDATTELAHARRHFFLPHRFRDPFHRTGFATESVVAYDSYDLAIRETRDALGNVTGATHDYRVLQPRLMTDPNGNQAEVAFDALGMVVGTAVMGKPGEGLGDSLAGFQADLSDAEIVAHLESPLTNPHAILQQATTRLVYDVFAYQRSQFEVHPQSAVAYALARETHHSDLDHGAGEITKIQHAFSYSDGFGREIQKKLQAEPGPLVPGGAEISPRWIGSGWTIFNNKGKPVRQYEPFFTDTHCFEFGVQRGVSPIICYDPLERVVATINPNHSWQKVVFDAWRHEIWDANDTVLIADPKNDPDEADYFRRLPESDYLPSWHAQRATGGMGALEQAAAAKAAVHAATPGTVHFDALGRSIVSIAHNRTQRSDMAQPEDALLVSRVVYDIQGREREVIDALGRTVVRYDHDLLGKRLHSTSMEAGERWMLADAAGRPLAGWDSRGHRLRTEHDVLGRGVGIHLQTGGGAEQLVTRTRYGESEPEAERSNLRGRIVQVADGAGLLSTAAYDFKGNALAGSRRLCADYQSVPDWRGEPALEPEVFTTSTSFDALNRPVTQTTPDGSVTLRGYDRAGALRTLEANLRGETANGQPVWTAFVTSMDYDARGQRLRIAYGNGAVTTHSYDPLTFRLTRLRTTVARRRVQDLAYTYDPVGNISRIDDDAQQTIFFRNRRVEPSNDYLYDATYQLIEADGREHLGQLNGVPNAPTPPDAFNCFHSGLEHPGDGNAMGRYIERYVYDAAGNFLEMRHVGSDPSHPGWMRRYAYEEPSLLEPDKVSNRLSWTQVGQGPQERMSYDAHGNMTSMAHLPVMRWDYLDRLAASAQQVVGEGGVPETTCYVYDTTGQRIRKVTERATFGPISERLSDRTVHGDFEVYREFPAAGDASSSRCETLHLNEGARRIALVETRQSVGVDGDERLVRWQIGDHISSVRIELDEKGMLLSNEEYFPYGGTSYQGQSAPSAAAKRYRHTARERDEESGLAHHGRRQFAPWLGRWTSADPIGTSDGNNLYSYVGNRPTALTDPQGTYGVPGHYYTVYFTSLATGMDPGTAARNAFFSYLPDMVYDFDAVNREAVSIGRWKGVLAPKQNEAESTERNRIHIGLHALTGGSAEAEREHRTQALRAQVPGTLGFGLASHAFGDAYSHSQLTWSDAARFATDGSAREAQSPQEPALYGPGLGHAAHLTWPDLIERRPALYTEYAGALYDVYAEKPGTPLLDRTEFMAVIERVAAAPDQQAQINVFREESLKLAARMHGFGPEQHGGNLVESVTEGMTGIDFGSIKYWQEFKNSENWPPFVPTGSVTREQIAEHAKQWTFGNWAYVGPP